MALILPLISHPAGIPVISAAITFSLIEPLSPQFTLTCVSTDGPAMAVTWARDGTAVYYDESHMLTQTVTDQFNIAYSNVLTVTGREPGNYTCSVANERGNASSQILTVEGKNCVFGCYTPVQ